MALHHNASHVKDHLKAHNTREALKNKEPLELHHKVPVIIEGQEVHPNRFIKVRVGPVIGEVTATTAIVLLEVTLVADIVAFLIPKEGDTVHVKQRFPANRPETFFFDKLKPETEYKVVFSGISKPGKHTGIVKTLPVAPTKLNIVVVSCDRPERQLDGEQNMWKLLNERIKAGEVDLMLHIGDQVYAEKESVDAAAVFRHCDSPDHPDQEQKLKLFKRTFKRAENRLRDVYRYTWTLPYTASVLSTVPHLMIWSDNDIFNDFTIAKGASPVLICIGQKTYREYQRALWDPNIEDDHDHSQEQHFHKYGHIGIAMLDMRGNRVDILGNQKPDEPIISNKQWAEFDALLNDPDITALLVASEIPFVSDPPAVVKAQAQKIAFLQDHWAYNEKDLLGVLDRVFDWKAKANGTKDAVLIGGDIHVGVTTTVHDKKTGVTIKQITTSPITNHVCDFFPKRENDLNERYSYKHEVLDKERNYGYFEVTATKEQGKIEAKLIGGGVTKGDH